MIFSHVNKWFSRAMKLSLAECLVSFYCGFGLLYGDMICVFIKTVDFPSLEDFIGVETSWQNLAEVSCLWGRVEADRVIIETLSDAVPEFLKGELFGLIGKLCNFFNILPFLLIIDVNVGRSEETLAVV